MYSTLMFTLWYEKQLAFFLTFSHSHLLNKQDTANSSCLGAAYRAAHGLAVKQAGEFLSFSGFVAERRPNLTLAAQPRSEAVEVNIL